MYKMKQFCLYLIIFFVSSCIILYLFFLVLESVVEKDKSALQTEPPHYICPGGYELELDHNPPRCIHCIRKLIEAEKRVEAEKQARIKAWYKKHPPTTTTMSIETKQWLQRLHNVMNRTKQENIQ